MPNSAEYIIAYFACWKLGALAGPVNSLLKAAGNCVCDLRLGSESAAGSFGFLPTIESIRNRLADLAEPSSSLTMKRPRQRSFTDGIDSQVRQNSSVPDINLDSEAIIIYTSGTTGKPKGCLLTHGNLIANARQISEWLGFTKDDRLLTIMPLFHMNAVSVTTMSALYAGGSTVVSPKFSASRFWQIISDYQITSFGSVATMLSMLLNTYPDGVPAGLKTDQLRFAMCGSAPVPAEVMKRFEETFNCLVIEGYGLSESTCRSTFNPPDRAPPARFVRHADRKRDERR